MADRYFPNQLPDFILESSSTEEAEASSASKDSLTKLLTLPFNVLSEKLKQSAIDLKETVVRETWGLDRRRVQDFTLYTGALGTAYLLFKAYQVNKDVNDLQLCSDIVKACDAASGDSSGVTFICGRSGVCALGAVVAKEVGDERLLGHYLTQFNKIKLPKDLPNELLYGRSGFLWACLFLNKHIGHGTVSSTQMRAVADDIIKAGRKLGHKARCPLMYQWHGKEYWGSAHGLAGIMHVLMDVQLKPDEMNDVKDTLRYMIKNRFPSGNYPSSKGNESDRLVHWCHGASGVALTIVKAAQVFGDKEFMQAAMEAGEVVWNRGLLKRVGLCHGISGNAYVFLSLYRLTGKVEFLYRGKAFACFLQNITLKLISEGKMHGGDHPFSLFEGVGGMAHLLMDMTEPSEARFPLISCNLLLDG